MRLEDAAHVGAGNPAPQDKEMFKGGKHPFFRTSDVGQVRFGELSASVDLLNDLGIASLRPVPRGTILMPKSGASTFLNHRVITGVDGYVSSHLATITAKKNLTDKRYLLYALSRVRAQELLPENSYPSLNLSLIKNIRILLPPLDEQRRIVAVLDEAFEGLDRARANVEANLRDATELFSSFRHGLYDPDKNDLVAHRFGDVATLQRGYDLPKKQRISGTYPIMSSSGAIDSHAEAKVCGPGVVTGRSGSIGTVHYVENDFWLLNTSLYVKDFHGNNVRFVFHLLAHSIRHEARM